VSDLKVTKEYHEDLSEPDEDGYYEWAYRWYGFEIDLAGRSYGAKIYKDEPDTVSIMGPLAIGRRDEQSERDLRVLARYFIDTEGVRIVEVIGAGGGFEPVDLEALFAASD
jgi:hypothetical protein